MQLARRIAVITAAAAAGGIAIVLAVLLLGGHARILGLATGTTFAWVFPLFTGVIVAAVSAVLLRITDTRRDGSPDLRTLACPCCNGPMVDEWRMCPHCGHRTSVSCGDEDASTVSARSGV